MNLPKPTPTLKAPRGPVRPKCECGHAIYRHVLVITDIERREGCEDCGFKTRRGSKFYPKCDHYRPRLSVRKPVPVARKEKRKPKCRKCAHPAKAHREALYGCTYCVACQGYVPSRRGSRQARRTPLAAIRDVADVLWSKLVKTKGACEIQQYHPHVCGGEHQSMHGAPRTFKATRWLLVNGFEGCRDVHKFFTERPEAWSALLLEAWGLEAFREIWARARSSEKPDMEATVAALREEARERGIS